MKANSSEITQKINEELKDSTFNFDDLNLEYFKHYYAEIKNSIELFNGFQLTTGISYHRRIPSKKKVAIDPGDDVEEILSQIIMTLRPRSVSPIPPANIIAWTDTGRSMSIRIIPRYQSK